MTHYGTIAYEAHTILMNAAIAPHVADEAHCRSRIEVALREIALCLGLTVLGAPPVETRP